MITAPNKEYDKRMMGRKKHEKDSMQHISHKIGLAANPQASLKHRLE